MGDYLDGYNKRVCGHCGAKRTPEGHDGCLGELDTSKVKNACCGHGENRMAYIQLWSGMIIQGDVAIIIQNEIKKCH